MSIQNILDTFSVSINQFEEIQADCQRFIKDSIRDRDRMFPYLDLLDPSSIRDRDRMFPYLDLLDPSISIYAQFGADKCSISDFRKWCKLLNIKDIPNDQQDEFHCVSHDKKITFTCGTLQDNYIHYLGVTGEFEKVHEAFTLFLVMGNYTELCWGNRNFI